MNMRLEKQFMGECLAKDKSLIDAIRQIMLPSEISGKGGSCISVEYTCKFELMPGHQRNPNFCKPHLQSSVKAFFRRQDCL